MIRAPQAQSCSRSCTPTHSNMPSQQAVFAVANAALASAPAHPLPLLEGKVQTRRPQPCTARLSRVQPCHKARHLGAPPPPQQRSVLLCNCCAVRPRSRTNVGVTTRHTRNRARGRQHGQVTASQHVRYVARKVLCKDGRLQLRAACRPGRRLAGEPQWF